MLLVALELLGLLSMLALHVLPITSKQLAVGYGVTVGSATLWLLYVRYRRYRARRQAIALVSGEYTLSSIEYYWTYRRWFLLDRPWGFVKTFLPTRKLLLVFVVLSSLGLASCNDALDRISEWPSPEGGTGGAEQPVGPRPGTVGWD